MPPSGRRDDPGPSPPTGPILLLVDLHALLAPPIPWARLHVLLVPLHAPPPLLYADDVAVLAPFLLVPPHAPPPLLYEDDVAVLAPFPPTLPPALLFVVSLPRPSLVASFLYIALSY